MVGGASLEELGEGLRARAPPAIARPLQRSRAMLRPRAAEQDATTVQRCGSFLGKRTGARRAALMSTQECARVALGERLPGRHVPGARQHRTPTLVRDPPGTRDSAAYVLYVITMWSPW